VIDSNWIKVPKLLPVLEPAGPLARRSLPPEVLTAYPRRSKVRPDPEAGLATVEAIVAALAILGESDPTLLEGYAWAAPFLDRNRWLFDPAAPAAGR